MQIVHLWFGFVNKTMGKHGLVSPFGLLDDSVNSMVLNLSAAKVQKNSDMSLLSLALCLVVVGVKK